MKFETTDDNCSHDKQCTVIPFIAQVPKMMKQNESKDHKNPVDTSLESESQIVRDMINSLPSPPQKEGGHEQSKKQGRAVKGNTFSEEHIGRLKHELNGTIKSLAREQIDRKSTRLNSSHSIASRMPSSA